MKPIADANRLRLIQERVKEYILVNELGPGDKLPTEGVLAERLHVSRTAVREALRSLEALGIIEARQGSGRIVRDFNFDAILNNLSYGLAFHNYSIYQAQEIRKALEVFFLEKGIANLNPQDVDELSAIVRRMQDERITDLLQFRQEDFRFHRLLFVRSGNDLALQLFEITWKIADAALRENTPQNRDAETLQVMRVFHEAILAAIVAGDVEQARKLVVDHFQTIEQQLLSYMESRGSEQISTA